MDTSTRQRPGQATPDASKTTATVIAPDPTARVRQAGGPETGGNNPRRQRREWRVEWRREDWSPDTGTKSRRWERRDDLDQFVARLTGPDRPDLSPLSFLRVSWRNVGPWHVSDGP